MLRKLMVCHQTLINNDRITEGGPKDESKVFYYGTHLIWRISMHNLLSHNQLAGWNQNVRHLEQTLDNANEQSQIVNDYYTCLIEYAEDSHRDQICKTILK